MGYYFTPTKMVLIKRQKIASVSQNVQDLNLHMLLMEMQTGTIVLQGNLIVFTKATYVPVF